jgi:ribose transport system ATP-binding protein
MLAGAMRPDEGTISIDGDDADMHSTHDAHQLGLAFVHQELDDFPELSVAENVALATGLPRRAGFLVDWRGLRQRAAEMLEELGADLDPARAVGSLSPAQRRTVMIASALYSRARLLVLDEPTAAMTGPEIADLHRLLRQLRESGVAVIYVSHRLDEIVTLCDRTLIMRGGRVVAEHRADETTHEGLVAEITGNVGLGDRERPAAPRRPATAVTGGAASEAVLSVEGLSRGNAVQDVTLDVAAGEVVGIGGLVGSGRTELVRLIAGADAPTGGRIAVRGRDVVFRSPADALRYGIALLPEDRRNEGLIQDFRIRENVTLSSLAKVRRAKWLPMTSKRLERKTTRGYIDRLEIKAEDGDQPTKTLSGGNQQKVALARWLLRGADLLIFDEPTHGIDVGAKESAFRQIDELAAAGKAVIVVSSELVDLERVCHRVIVLSEGRVAGALEGSAITEEAILACCYGRDRGTKNPIEEKSHGEAS